MTKTYLKRIAAPKTWSILRRTTAFVKRAKPSGHPMERSLPIVIIMRDYLGIVKTAAQANKVLKSLEVSVNGRRVRTTADSAGFMDVITIGKESYRITINKSNALALVHTKKAGEAMIRRLSGKTTITGGKMQLNMDGGLCLIVAKAPYKVGDSLVLKDGKVSDHLPLAKGSSILVTGGSHIGSVGTVESIEGDVITVKADDGTFETTKAYAYVIGKEKPLITLG